MDLGDGGSIRSRRSYVHQQGEDEDDGTSEDDDSEQDSDLDDGGDDDDQVQLALRDKEEALVEAALARIRRAQAKGKKDVKLSKGELAALERRRERLNAENSRRKRKEKEPRIAVPLSHLEPTSLSGPEPPGAFGADQEHTNYPPMGYFPPPSGSRTRPRSGTSSSQRPPSRNPNVDRSRASSPFRYSYVQPPDFHPSTRHASDPAVGPRSMGPPSHEEDWPPGLRPGSRQSQAGVDPFLYMTGGSRVPSYNSRPAAPRRHGSGSAGDRGVYMYGPGPGAFPRETTSTGASRRMSPEESSDETASEDDGEQSPKGSPRQGARPGVGGADTRSKRGRRRDDVIIVEDPPEPEPEAEPRRQRESDREHSSQRGPKKAPATGSPTKRKPVPSGGSKRRKGK
ncbi:hypothetical protein QBC33DRAFT_301033 [Phialemonium atrogriseum]|uniref:Uncharacterized protein n=1 Tax=Phialemonium atrogriseum TaxID=1093897 RepID=A0AAJ0C6Y8_9PEZI|nr:uncharacterized protein QBC33DRAFT_301033 [Phialemonium atrogriseum]KAK1769852.1 hypothetical protein QBC33DRAFT_301033 [Phialemonium atrogriseum]